MPRLSGGIFLLSCVLIVLVPVLTPAQGAARVILRSGNIERGAGIAAQWCSECHVTGPGLGSDLAPSFGDIAWARDDAYLRAYLSDSHGRLDMPPIPLDRGEIDALVAYMGTLR